MPIYEYRCNACGAEFEKLQRTTQAPTPTCPQCAATDVGRKVSLSSFQLKGTGWYSSDYKPAAPPPRSESAESAPSAAATSAPSVSAGPAGGTSADS